eukprot:COSAG06_NODE_6804_length_2770_cov_4.593785_2_plen_71_part_00
MPPSAPTVAESLLEFHRQLQQEPTADATSSEEEGLPSWLIGLLMICGMCCVFAAIGKYKFEADGALCSSC